ncbi:MAG: hypothetical protein AB8H47_19870 [Bacteroidia bacterium]
MMDWEKIIQEKPLVDLSPEERIAIESEMSPAEYNTLYETWQSTRRYFHETEPKLKVDPRIRQKVRTHMRALDGDDLGSKVRRLLAKRIPAYQAVAAAVAVIALIHFGGNLLPQQSSGFDSTVNFISDTTHQDSSHRVGFNLYEDSALSKFMIEAL